MQVGPYCTGAEARLGRARARVRARARARVKARVRVRVRVRIRVRTRARVRVRGRARQARRSGGLLAVVGTRADGDHGAPGVIDSGG